MSEQTRRDVWVALLDAERQTRYYGKQLERHSFLQTVIDVILIASGSLGLIFLAAKLHPLIPTICIVIGSLASIYARIGKHARKAASVYWIRKECASLGRQWEALWSRVQSGLVDDETAQMENQHLQQQLEIATAQASLVGISVDDKANRAAWKEAIEVKAGQYA